MRKEFEKIAALTKSAKIIFLAGHKEPDGDSLGSMLALGLALKRQKKQVFFVSSGPIPKKFSFMPEIWQIKPRQNASQPDLIFCLDFGDAKRIDLANLDSFPQDKIICIDHHPLVKQISGTSIVDPQASSTCEIISLIFQKLNWPISKQIALCLLTGILTDTKCFYHNNVTSQTLKIAGELLARAGSLGKIIRHSFSNEPQTLKAWGSILDKITIDKKIGLVVAALSFKDRQAMDFDEQELAGLTGFLNFTQESKVALVLFEKEPGLIKGSLRSKKLNVANLAEKLGGGGHRLAAGFETEGKMENIITAVREELLTMEQK